MPTELAARHTVSGLAPSLPRAPAPFLPFHVLIPHPMHDSHVYMESSPSTPHSSQPSQDALRKVFYEASIEIMGTQTSEVEYESNKFK